jgi:hypothetical protein
MRRVICDRAGIVKYIGHLHFRGDLAPKPA